MNEFAVKWERPHRYCSCPKCGKRVNFHELDMLAFCTPCKATYEVDWQGDVPSLRLRPALTLPETYPSDIFRFHCFPWFRGGWAGGGGGGAVQAAEEGQK